MYTAANAAREIAVVVGAWVWTIGWLVWLDSESVRCNGSGCTGTWE